MIQRAMAAALINVSPRPSQHMVRVAIGVCLSVMLLAEDADPLLPRVQEPSGAGAAGLKYADAAVPSHGGGCGRLSRA